MAANSLALGLIANNYSKLACLSLKRLLTPTSSSCVQKRNIIYSWKKDFNRDTIAKLQQEIDTRPVAIYRWKKRKEWEKLQSKHMFFGDLLMRMGSDLSIAYFVTTRGGAVRFCDIDRWFESSRKDVPAEGMPLDRDDSYRVEAVDMSNTQIMYSSFDNIDPVSTLKWMNLSNCKYVDDWCLDRLSMYRFSLEYLDISGCPKISERGLATLHRLRELKRLKIDNLPGVSNKALTMLMLEEVMPWCFIEGVEEELKHSENEEKTGNLTEFESFEATLMAQITADLTGGDLSVPRVTHR